MSSYRDDRLPPLQQEPEWATSTNVSRVMGGDRSRASILMASGALGTPRESVDGRLIIAPDRLRRIAAEGRRPLAELPTGILFKVGPATYAPDGTRDWHGWDAALSADQRVLATTRWWAVNDAEGYIGTTLTVTIQQIVVEQYQITSVIRREASAKVGFEVTTSPHRDEWLGRRVATRRASAYDLTGALAPDRGEKG